MVLLILFSLVGVGTFKRSITSKITAPVKPVEAHFESVVWSANIVKESTEAEVLIDVYCREAMETTVKQW